MKNAGYLFLVSKSSDLIRRGDDLKIFLDLTSSTGKHNQNIIVGRSKSAGNQNILFNSIINDFNYKNSENEHSLYSSASYENGIFKCKTDIYGVQSHYYYKEKETFIASNNLIYIAYLTGEKYSEESIFDALVFKKPRRERTWFKNIKCLTPGESLTYSQNENALTKNKSKELYETLFSHDKNDFIEVFTDFFTKFKATGTETNIGLSLSAGADSRAVLAGLLSTGKKFTAYSWGGQNYFETFKD